MQPEEIKFLTWDTDFFHKKIGRIDCGVQTDLPSLLLQARKVDYELIYVFCNGSNFLPPGILEAYNGSLVDRKVIYENKLLIAKELNFPVEEYLLSEVSEELEQLAYVSGRYSRFRMDANFHPDDFYKMYQTWIAKSVSREIADKVFVIREKDQIRGMVTLKITDGKGVIGLIAVSPLSQGKGYGQILNDACCNELVKRNINTLEVATQLDNVSGCRFYEKCGFSVQSVTNIYHCWL